MSPKISCRCAEPVSASLTVYAIHEFWKYNKDHRLYNEEKERSDRLLKELIALRLKEGQNYIDDEIKHTHIPKAPTENGFFEFLNLMTCGFFR